MLKNAGNFSLSCITKAKCYLLAVVFWNLPIFVDLSVLFYLNLKNGKSGQLPVLEIVWVAIGVQ